jgi:hypothetical protein
MLDKDQLIRVWNLDVDRLFGDLLEEQSPKHIPHVDFADVNRWRNMPPLQAARGWGQRAGELAERAEWEAGVARQAIERGDMLLAIDALDLATRRVNGARFLEALMSNAIGGWKSAGEGVDGIAGERREVSPPMQQLVLRTRTAIEVVDRVLKDLRASAQIPEAESTSDDAAAGAAESA